MTLILLCLNLNAQESDGSSDLTSDYTNYAGTDCLLYSLHRVFVYLYGRSRSALQCFKLSTSVPLPKVHSTNSTASANFRGIALSSIFGKLFDKIILEHCHDKLVSCDLQFGFKSKSSTSLCSFVLFFLSMHILYSFEQSKFGQKGSPQLS